MIHSKRICCTVIIILRIYVLKAYSVTTGIPRLVTLLMLDVLITTYNISARKGTTSYGRIICTPYRKSISYPGVHVRCGPGWSFPNHARICKGYTTQNTVPGIYSVMPCLRKSVQPYDLR